jgi:hypothetical protein
MAHRFGGIDMSPVNIAASRIVAMQQPSPDAKPVQLLEKCEHTRSADCMQFLPMTPTATPVSATAKEQHQNNDDKDQFHGNPL